MHQLTALALTGPSFVDELRRAWDHDDAVLPVDTRLPLQAQRSLIQRLGATTVVDADGARTQLTTGWPVEAGDALVVVTSGTTGEPKGVVHTHASVRASAERTSERLGVTASDRWLACLPVAHIGGLSVITRALLTTTPLTVLPAFDAEAVEQSARDGATLVSLVNAALQRIDPSLFRLILLGGAAMPLDRPTNTVATYGSSETGSGIVYEKTPLRDVDLRIEAGEILVKSPTLMRCYRDGSTPVVDGWFPTGDAGSLDSGFLDVFGRIDDVINSGGEKIWPTQVEAALRQHSSVAEALVLGVPDSEWGERVVARIEVAPSADVPTLDELREHVKKVLPAYAAPKELQVVEQLPRTTSGKLVRNLQRANE